MNIDGYCQLEYVSNELKDIFAATNVFVSRSGATVIFELLSLNKPMLLIPLSKKASRGDQILNAASFSKCGYAAYVEEENLNVDSFYEQVLSVYQNRNSYIENQLNADVDKSIDKVLNVINTVIKERG